MTEFGNQFIRANLKFGEFHLRGKYYYLLELFNLTDALLNIKVSLTERVIISGEKIPQKQWGGSVNGIKGIALDPSGFCHMHLVYIGRPSEDEKINVVIDVLTHALRLNFKFQAPHVGYYKEAYRLVDCSSQNLSESKSVKNNAEWNALLNRIDDLESMLLKALSRIEILEQDESAPRIAALNAEQFTQESFDDVMDWLLEQKSVELAQLRARLLPLNFLVESVIADLNEKALDQTGDLALEDDGKQVVVNRSILQKVLGKP